LGSFVDLCDYGELCISTFLRGTLTGRYFWGALKEISNTGNFDGDRLWGALIGMDYD